MSSTETGPVVLERRRDGLAHLVLSRPPRNEMGPALLSALARQVEALGRRPPALGLVVRGAGRHFSSGADLSAVLALAASDDERRAAAFFERSARALAALSGLPCPSVAAVSGCCLGSGLELALACTYRVAAPGAVLALPEVEHGLVPGCGGAGRLVALAGRRRAMELVLSGRSLGAEEALALGLVDRLAPRRELVEAAERLLRRAAPPGRALRGSPPVES